MVAGAPSLLELDHVWKTFRTGAFGAGELAAVRDVSFSARPGTVIALVGESGSGKTTIGRMILRLTSVTSGRIRFEGNDIAGLRRRRLKDYYAHVQGVFQDPFSSYNPIFKADRVFATIHDEYFPGIGGSDWAERIEASLRSVGLNPADVLHKFPHQLSGGQLQRLLVARALLLDLKFLVADEIISMLDASTRIDVLNLLGELKAQGLGILFITHDLSLANYISDKAIILRRGRIVEMGPTPLVFGNPAHRYTIDLLAAVPRLRERWPSRARTPTGAPGGPEAEGARTTTLEAPPLAVPPAAVPGGRRYSRSPLHPLHRAPAVPAGGGAPSVGAPVAFDQQLPPRRRGAPYPRLAELVEVEPGHLVAVDEAGP